MSRTDPLPLTTLDYKEQTKKHKPRQQDGPHSRSPLHLLQNATRSIAIEADDSDSDDQSRPLTAARKNSHSTEDDKQYAALRARRKRYKLMAIGFIVLLVAGILTNILLSAHSSGESHGEIEGVNEDDTSNEDTPHSNAPSKQKILKQIVRSPSTEVPHGLEPAAAAAATAAATAVVPPTKPAPCVPPPPPPPPPTKSLTFLLQPSLADQLSYDRDSPHFNLWDRSLSLPDDIAAPLNEAATRSSAKQWWKAHAEASKLILDESDEWHDKEILNVPLVEPPWITARNSHNASFVFLFPHEITLREERVSKPDSCSPREKQVKSKVVLRLLHSRMQTQRNEACLERKTGIHAQFGEVSEGFQLKPPEPVANLAAPHPCGSARRVLKGIQHGKWVGRYEWFHGGPFYQTLVQGELDEFDHQFAYYSACPLLHYTPEQVCEIMARFTRIILIGEESMTHLFLALLMLTNGNWETGHLNTQVREATEQQRMYVKEHCSGNKAFLPDCAPYWSLHLKDLLYDSCPAFRGAAQPEDQTFKGKTFVSRSSPLEKLSLKSWRKEEDTLPDKWGEVGNTQAQRLSDMSARRFQGNPIHIGGLAVVDTGSTELLQGGSSSNNLKENSEKELRHMQSLESFYQKLTASFQTTESAHTTFHPLWMPMDRVQDDTHQRFGVSEDSAPYLADHLNWKVNERVAHILRGVNRQLRETSADIEYGSRINGVVNRIEKMINFELDRQEITAPFRIKKQADSKGGVATFASSEEFMRHEAEQQQQRDSFTASNAQMRMCPSPITSPFTPLMREWTALNFRALTECVPPSWSIDGIHYIPTVHIMKATALVNYMHALILEYDAKQYQ